MQIIKRQRFLAVAIGTSAWLCAPITQAVTNVFFSASQTAVVVATNTTSTTIQSGAYQFTYSVDGYWSAFPGGPPTGRFFSVFWPDGVQAQAITAGPTVGSGANITIKRADGMLFDFLSFTGKLLANTAGAGGAFEVMPQLNGQDALADPLQFDATGNAGNSFPHTPALTGYDTYIIHLWVDYALTQLTLVDASLPPPELQISMTSSNYVRLNWPTNSTGFALLRNSDVGTTNWLAVTNEVNMVGADNQVVVPATNHLLFFRLRHP
jgi:hypothetical protein